jgi:choline dehydrogenase-like flavoprotein
MRYDAVVIGTGFGGAVVACRLVQAGARICVLERGRRFEANDFTVANAQSLDGAVTPLRRPGFHGLWDLRDLRGVQALQASGYGGGSLIYAGVHLRPPGEVFDSGWPAGYSREALDPYFDLAAYMLDAKPITSSGTIKPLRKSERLRAAARALGRGDQMFEPPLAINFGDPEKPAKNSFDRPQSGCRACGRCMLGCSHGAKNSLDLNYLAVVEDERDQEGRPLADIRTLAEAVSIAPAPGIGDLESGYRVAYEDHLENDRKEVSARWVFVCAGSLGSTELLLRSRPHLAGVGPAVGSDFFCNADSLGVVFDTREPSGMSEGPTISTSLLHRGKTAGSGVADDAWILIQEGALVPPLTVPTAGLRSEALLNRNRYRESESDSPSDARVARTGPWNPEPTGPPASVSLPHQPPLGYSLSTLSRDAAFTRMIPVQMRQAVSAIFQPIRARGEAELRAVRDGVVQRLAVESSQALAARIGSLLGSGPRARAAVGFATTWLATHGLRLGQRIAGLSDELVANAVRSELRARTGGNGLEQMATSLLRLVPGTVPGDSQDPQRCFVLLAIGRDAVPGRLLLGNDGLLAELDVLSAIPVYDMQERLMRDIAGQIGAELRTSPFWEANRRPITVHPHGGCPMGDDPHSSVVDPWGEVHGCPGLFVMDAAALPRSLGLNPSATIAAIAERNIEHHIRRHFGEAWSAPQWKAAEQWRATIPDHVIDPLLVTHDRAEGSPTPVARSIGITFVESMKGFHSGLAVDKGTLEPATCEAAAADGRALHQALSFDLRCTIPEIRAFLADPLHAMQTEGTVSIAFPAVGLNGTYAARGTLQVMAPAAHDGERVFRYELLFSKGVRRYRLDGLKRVRTHPELEQWKAIWSDTSVLWVRLISLGDGRPADERVVSHGVLRLPAETFMYEMLPSFEVVGTSDPARVVWTMGAFLQVFFGGLAAAYFHQQSALPLGEPKPVHDGEGRVVS